MKIYLCNFFFILSFYDVSVVCMFVKVIQIAPIYRFGEFFLIELDFFIIYFFLILLKK
jgi:hypothetical protein